jgi:hypothetical protein
MSNAAPKAVTRRWYLLWLQVLLPWSFRLLCILVCRQRKTKSRASQQAKDRRCLKKSKHQHQRLRNSLHRLRIVSLLGCVAGLLGCGSRAPTQAKTPSVDDFLLVATERGLRGPRLVGIAANGDRQFDVIEPAATLVRDSNPAISPDGKTVIFASSRGRAGDGQQTSELGQTSLWLAPLGYEQRATRLTFGSWIDTHPCWLRDGSGVIFSSTKSGTFDLWRLSLPSGELTQLTHDSTHEVTPSVAPDGSIVFAVVAPEGQQPSSHIEAITSQGRRTITEGPADSSPAFSPDGATVVFAAPQVRNHVVDGKSLPTVDGDLFSIPFAGGTATSIFNAAGTDEGGPVFSPDGRLLFATSLLRAADGRVVFSSVAFVDTIAHTAPQVVVDRAGPVERLTPTFRSGHPDAVDLATLRKAPDYRSVILGVIRTAIERSGVTPSP